MPVIQLSEVQSALEKKFGDFEVHTAEGVARFRPVLRLTKDKRQEWSKALNITERAKLENDDDIFDVYKDAFRITARTEGDYTLLCKAVGDDPAVWTELFRAFNEDTQAGEASTSES